MRDVLVARAHQIRNDRVIHRVVLRRRVLEIHFRGINLERFEHFLQVLGLILLPRNADELFIEQFQVFLDFLGRVPVRVDRHEQEFQVEVRRIELFGDLPLAYLVVRLRQLHQRLRANVRALAEPEINDVVRPVEVSVRHSTR